MASMQKLQKDKMMDEIISFDEPKCLFPNCDGKIENVDDDTYGEILKCDKCGGKHLPIQGRLAIIYEKDVWGEFGSAEERYSE